MHIIQWKLEIKFSLWLYQAMNLLILVQLRYLSLLLLRGQIMNVFNFTFLIYLFFFGQILLKSPGDIRLYQIECTAIPDFSNTCIEFETPVLQKCTQDIPIVCCFCYYLLLFPAFIFINPFFFFFLSLSALVFLYCLYFFLLEESFFILFLIAEYTCIVPKSDIYLEVH